MKYSCLYLVKQPDYITDLMNVLTFIISEYLMVIVC